MYIYQLYQVISSSNHSLFQVFQLLSQLCLEFQLKTLLATFLPHLLILEPYLGDGPKPLRSPASTIQEFVRRTNLD